MTSIDWSKYNINTAPKFSLKDTECFARVVQIYDGDTLTAVIPLLNQFYKFSIRLEGIDTCELSSTTHENKIIASKAKNRLIELVTQKTAESLTPDLKTYLINNVELVYLSCQDFDKYGRILASVKKTKEDLESFSQILMKEKLAYSYDGKKKLNELEQINLLQ